ncbi:MAG: hypothetical protein HZB51_30680 [Chloroflexi bacterium]|nr:hypothetical protein [Chloroflexota bacterium]
MEKSHTLRIAYFISPHGFGHASRAAAVMNALNRILVSPKGRNQDSQVHFQIFTLVPRWFFQQSVTAPYTYHPLLTDIGLVQESSLRENIPQTLKRLREFLPFNRQLVSDLAVRITKSKCALVMCDIAPLGIAVAQAANVPSILIENFTWDWIYEGYAKSNARFNPHIEYLRGMFRSADYHLQTEPVCDYWDANLVTTPVSREPRTSKKDIRAQLGIPQRARVVMITMGGIPEQHSFLDRLTTIKNVYFIIPGAATSIRRQDNLALLPHRSKFYHPDLMNASDAVIGKAGYSTVAEAYHAGIPFGHVQREKFREAVTMEKFIRKQMHGIEIPASEFQNGEWFSTLSDLLDLPRIHRRERNGAEQIAEFTFAQVGQVS